jgi:hypothetical protein
MKGRQVNDDEQTMTNIHALTGIQTHGLSVQAAYASDIATRGRLYRLEFTCIIQESLTFSDKSLVPL